MGPTAEKAAQRPASEAAVVFVVISEDASRSPAQCAPLAKPCRCSPRQCDLAWMEVVESRSGNLPASEGVPMEVDGKT